ncbi:MAG: pilin [Patescibacteria group bacterium]|nr:pilin [Patescibacteria group bacterium]
MIQKIKSSMFVLATMLMGAVPLLVPVTVHASIASSVCQGTNIATSDTGSAGTGGECTDSSSTASTGGLYKLAANVVNIFSIIVGIIAVIMIIYGGFKYITSGGDSGNVSGAKNTLIYAIVGLIIVALAQFIVHFVLKTADSATTAG